MGTQIIDCHSEPFPSPPGAGRVNHIVDVRKRQFQTIMERHRLASLFSSPLWIEVLARTYGFDISASASASQGQIESAVLFSRVSDLRGERIICLPFSDYCDPLVHEASVWDELIQQILAFNVPVTLRCLRNEIPTRDQRFAAEATALWHGVDLTRPEEEIWAGLSGSARQNIRRAERNGVLVREARSAAAVHDFHRMHCHLRKTKYRLLAQPKAFFDNLHEVFAAEDRLFVLLAVFDGTPIAGIVFLEWGDTLYYKFNASVDTRLRPNDLLAWEGIRLARRRGLARLDFGLSDRDQPGLVRYKRKYASEEREIVTLRWAPHGHSDGRGEQAARTLNRITRLLTHPDVPIDIAAAAGDELYRFFC